jgi:hypothetical protein
MAAVRKPSPVSMPAQIDQEVAPDENGQVAESTVEELGALNAEAVAANRNRAANIGRKKAGEKNISWGESNACPLYDAIVEVYAPSSLHILVERESGGDPVSHYVMGQPRNGLELHACLLREMHVNQLTCTYRVRFQDANTHMFRGTGRITLPANAMNGHAAPAPQAPYGYAAPPQHTYPAPVPPFLQPAAPAPPAPNGPAATGPDIVMVMQLQKQLSDIGAQLAAALRGQQQPVAMAPASAAAPVAAAVPAQPQPPALAAPPGYVIVVTQNGQQVLVPSAQLGLGGAPAAGAPAAAAAAVKPLTPQEQVASTMSWIKGGMEAAQQIASLVPAAVVPPAADPEPEPTKMVQLGDIKAVTNTLDGSIRLVDTAIANAPTIMQWIERQQQIFAARQRGEPIPPPPQPSQPAAGIQSLGIPTLPGT